MGELIDLFATLEAQVDAARSTPMVTPRQDPQHVANYVRATVAASLEPGGPLHTDLIDLLVDVRLIAMRTAGIADDDDAAALAWPEDQDERMQEQLIAAIAEAAFQEARAYLEARAEPVPV